MVFATFLWMNRMSIGLLSSMCTIKFPCTFAENMQVRNTNSPQSYSCGIDCLTKQSRALDDDLTIFLITKYALAI